LQSQQQYYHNIAANTKTSRTGSTFLDACRLETDHDGPDAGASPKRAEQHGRMAKKVKLQQEPAVIPYGQKN
jgi:hypothetical protein